jgi:IclR family mhp operon transcriptional activator
MGPYPKVRALERGLAILIELNMRGRARAADLAEASGVDRSTTYRMLSTMADLDLVMRSEVDGAWTLGAGVRRLSDGFTDSDALLSAVAREIVRMLPEVRWPSSFGSFHRGRVIIRETTHHLSNFTVHRAMVGRYRPLTRSSIGQAILSYATDDERAAMLEVAIREGAPDAAEAADKKAIRRMVTATRERGYSASTGGVEQSISAIAVPVRYDGRVLGAVSVAFFRKVMTVEDAAERHLPRLRSCVEAIEATYAETHRLPVYTST